MVPAGVLPALGGSRDQRARQEHTDTTTNKVRELIRSAGNNSLVALVAQPHFIQKACNRRVAVPSHVAIQPPYSRVDLRQADPDSG